jgi:hypothetical protein
MAILYFYGSLNMKTNLELSRNMCPPGDKKLRLSAKCKTSNLQGVTEIGALILTGNRTRQKEQLFYLPFCRKTMFNSKKKLERFFSKIALRH